jgi:hypothetical protein
MEQGPDPLYPGHPPPSPVPGYWELSLLAAFNKDGLDSVVANCEQPNLEYVALSWAVSRTLPFFKTNYSEKY